MAKLSDYAATFPAPQQIKLKINVVFWVSVGDATMIESDDYHVNVEGSGTILAVNFKGSIDIRLEDRDPEATSGPCSIALNGMKDDHATYSVESGELIISATLNGADRTVRLSKSGNETYVALGNVFPVDVKGRLVPA